MLIQIEIPKETIMSCIESATGRYIRYWAETRRRGKLIDVREVYVENGTAGKGAGEWCTLTPSRIHKAASLLAKASPRQFAALITDRADAITGDCLIQLAVLGEIRYG